MRTKQSDEDIANLVLVLVIVITALVVAMGVVGIAAESYKSENQRFKSFLTEKYNFSGEECVEWQCIGGKSLEQARKEGLGGCGIECISYCHTRQVQDEECDSGAGGCCFIDNETLKEKCIGSETFIPDCSKLGKETRGFGRPPKCTPKFRNENYGCQSGDDVRRVREMIG